MMAGPPSRRASATERRAPSSGTSVWNAAVASVGGFISFHMRVNIKMGFALVAAHGVAVAVVRIAAAPLWGRAVDRLGARPVLVLCSFGVTVVPVIWMLPTPDQLWPIVLEALIAGVLWGGHGIASVDLSVALAPRCGRPFYLAAFATAGGPWVRCRLRPGGAAGLAPAGAVSPTRVQLDRDPRL